MLRPFIRAGILGARDPNVIPPGPDVGVNVTFSGTGALGATGIAQFGGIQHSIATPPPHFTGSGSTTVIGTKGGGGGGGGGGTPVTLSAADVTNNIGTVTHCGYPTYSTQETGWIAALNDIGIKHIRDRVGADSGRVMGKIHGNGVKATLVLGAPWGAGFITNVDTAISTAKANYQGSWLDAIEGPNEPDAFGGSASATHTWMNEMYPKIRGDSWFNGVPVKSPAWAFTSGLSSYGHDTMEDICNMHTYLSGDIPEGPKLASWISAAQAVYGSTKPMSVTEWGYHTDTSATAHVDEATQADYHIRSVFWFLLKGVLQASVYEFLDDPHASSAREQNFGIVRSNLTYKPVATALKNLLGLMVDNGTGSLITAYPYTYTTSGTDVEVVPLGRKDGSIDFAVWRKAPVYNFSTNTRITVSPVAVNFTLTTTTNRSAVAYRLNTGGSTTLTASGKTFTVQADGNVQLVRVS